MRGTDYTNESFLRLAINSIENTDLTPKISTSGICGQTWTIEGWNYVRTAQTKAVSAAFVNDANNYADILAAVLIAAASLRALYYNTFSKIYSIRILCQIVELLLMSIDSRSITRYGITLIIMVSPAYNKKK